MAINQRDDYEKLAKLLYPSVEASGNVYYGQTRKLTMDEVFDKNGKGFHSYIKSLNSTNGNYETFLYWEIGPLKGVVKVPSILPCIPQCFAKYEISIEPAQKDNLLYSGNFYTYEKDIKATFKSIEITRGKIPTDLSTDWDGANFYIENNSDKHYIYIALKNNSYNPDYTYEYTAPEYVDGNEFAFKFSGNYTSSTCYIWIYGSGTQYNVNIYEYSINDGSWQTYTTASNGYADASSELRTIIIHHNDIIKFRLKSNATKLTQSHSNHIEFRTAYCDGTLSVSGDIRSLQSDKNIVQPYEFYYLLYMIDALVDASNLVLPSPIVKDHGYAYLFFRCRNLKSSPKILPASDLSCIDYESGSYTLCYGSMFDECDSLEYAPDLPSNNLSYGCYFSMFSYCPSLKRAPSLPAKDVPNCAYSYMFSHCTSLKKIPDLPATSRGLWCYEYMFYECTSLEFTQILIGDFSLDDTEFVQCYYRIFEGCTKLNTVHSYMYGNLTSNGNGWLSGVSSNGKFYSDPDTQWPISSNGIPNGWDRYNIYSEYGDANYLINQDSYIFENTIISSGTDSIYNGKGKFSETHSSEKSFDENFTHRANTYNSDGSFNQDIWGYKSFNSPIQFRNGIYGEDFAITSMHSKFSIGPSSLMEAYSTAISRNLDDKDTANIKLKYAKYISSSENYFSNGVTLSNGVSDSNDPEITMGVYSSVYDSGEKHYSASMDYLDEYSEISFGISESGISADYNNEDISSTFSIGKIYDEDNDPLSLMSATADEIRLYSDQSIIKSDDIVIKPTHSNTKCSISIDGEITECALPTPSVGSSSYDVVDNSYYLPGGLRIIDIPIGAIFLATLNSDYNSSNYLTLTAEGGGVTVKLNHYGGDTSTYQYRVININGSIETNWTTATAEDISKFIYEKQSMQFRIASYDSTKSDNKYVQFSFEGGYIVASGSINSIATVNDQFGSYPLPGSYCFCNLFKNCTRLLRAPKLPSQNLTNYCYYHTFEGCTSLKYAPSLSTEYLSTSTPPLSCYEGMFSGCTSLKSTPGLKDKYVANSMYKDMFSGCTSLEHVFTAAETVDVNATSNWLSGISKKVYFHVTGSSIPNNMITSTSYQIKSQSYNYYNKNIVNLPPGYEFSAYDSVSCSDGISCIGCVSVGCISSKNIADILTPHISDFPADSHVLYSDLHYEGPEILNQCYVYKSLSFIDLHFGLATDDGSHADYYALALVMRVK